MRAEAAGDEWSIGLDLDRLRDAARARRERFVGALVFLVSDTIDSRRAD
jgi:hypothetical protein